MRNSYQRITMLIIIHAKHAFLFSDAADDNDATFPGNRLSSRKKTHLDIQLMRALDFSMRDVNGNALCWV